MIYLITAILILLFIALIFVFRPPKPMEDDDAGEHSAESIDTSTIDPPDPGSALTEAGEEEAGGDVLILDDAEDYEQLETGAHEEELDLTFAKPDYDQDVMDDSVEELELDLEEDEELHSEIALENDVAALTDDIEAIAGAEPDEEDVPFIIEDEPAAGESGGISPALGDVPEDYEQLDEDEAPEELAERLDFFLGTDNDESSMETDAAEADQNEEALTVEEPEEREDSSGEEQEEAEEPTGEEAQTVPLDYGDAPVAKQDEEDSLFVDEEQEVASYLAGHLESEANLEQEVTEPEEAEEEPAEQAEPETDSSEEVLLTEEIELDSEQPQDITNDTDLSETLAEVPDEPESPPIEKTASEEDISIIAEDSTEITPALGDVPDDYAQLDEDEAPEELAERLEYFLGTEDAEETIGELEEPVTGQEPAAETHAEEEQAEEIEEFAGTEEIVTPEPVAETGPEGYSSFLADQEVKLRSALREAIQQKETEKIALLSLALENLCAKQADVSQSFQLHQQMLEAVEGILNELQQTLPGFQLEAARTSLKNGEYEVVRNLIDAAASQLDGSPQPAARVLYFWGRFEEERGELVQASELFDRGQSLDPENMDCIFSSGRLARIGGDLDKALSLLEQRVKSGMEKGEEGIGLARANFELAKTLAAMDNEPERVEALLTQALETVENALGASNPNLGPVLHELAVFHDSAGRYEQAEPLYKRSLEVVEQALGPESPRLGQTLNKMAGLYEEMEKGDKAEVLYRRALEVRQKVLGDEHPDIGAIMGHLANRLRARKQYDEAEPLFKKSLEIAEAALGKDHPNLAMVYNDMAELYSSMGNEQQAEQYQERAFAAFGMPGMGDGFVEMEKDTGHDGDENDDQQIAGG